MDGNAKLKNAFKKKLLFFKNLLKVLILIWKTSRFHTCWLAFNTLVMGLIPIITLWLNKKLIDSVVLAMKTGFTNESFQPVVFWIILEFSLTVFGLLITNINNYLNNIFGRMISNYIRVQIYKKAISLDMSFFDNEAFYDSLSKANREAGQRPFQILMNIINLFQIIITISGMLYIFSTFTVLVFIIILITTLPIIFAEIKYARKRYDIQIARTNEQRQQGYWGYLITDQLAIKEVHIFQLGKHLIKSIKEMMKKFLNQDKSFHSRKNLIQFFLQLVAKLSFYSLTVYFAYLTIISRITLGDLNMVTSAIKRTQDILKRFLLTISQLYESELFIKDLFSFTTLKPEIDQESTEGLPLTKIEKIEYIDVSFKYPHTKECVLKDINFVIKPGEKIALVGVNGSGKTTLIKLLVRLYNPSSGSILINDIEIEKYNIKDLRKQIGVIFQDFLHYQVTVKNNIGYGNIDEVDNRDEIINASKKGKAYSFINRLPKKFDSMLGRLFEREGCELSTGQWQKIALSRAFMKENASVVILDEPTAALDIETEYKIFSTFQEMIGDKISILISHRMSTIVKCDKIFVLKDGVIVEEGSHDSLLKQKKEYANMYELYSRIYINS